MCAQKWEAKAFQGWGISIKRKTHLETNKFSAGAHRWIFCLILVIRVMIIYSFEI